MLRTFSANSIEELERMITSYEEARRLRIDCFSIVYNGQYEALVKFGVRL